MSSPTSTSVPLYIPLILPHWKLSTVGLVQIQPCKRDRAVDKVSDPVQAFRKEYALADPLKRCYGRPQCDGTGKDDQDVLYDLAQ